LVSSAAGLTMPKDTCPLGQASEQRGRSHRVGASLNASRLGLSFQDSFIAPLETAAESRGDIIPFRASHLCTATTLPIMQARYKERLRSLIEPVGITPEQLLQVSRTQ